MFPGWGREKKTVDLTKEGSTVRRVVSPALCTWSKEDTSPPGVCVFCFAFHWLLVHDLVASAIITDPVASGIIGTHMWRLFLYATDVISEPKII